MSSLSLWLKAPPISLRLPVSRRIAGGCGWLAGRRGEGGGRKATLRHVSTARPITCGWFSKPMPHRILYREDCVNAVANGEVIPPFRSTQAVEMGSPLAVFSANRKLVVYPSASSFTSRVNRNVSLLLRIFVKLTHVDDPTCPPDRSNIMPATRNSHLVTNSAHTRHCPLPFVLSPPPLLPLTLQAACKLT